MDTIHERTAEQQSDAANAAVIVTDDEPCRSKELLAALQTKKAYEEFVRLLICTKWLPEVRGVLDRNIPQHEKLLKLCSALDRLYGPLLQHSLQAVAHFHTQWGTAEAQFQQRAAVHAAHHGLD